jgi:hypothetical protein
MTFDEVLARVLDLLQRQRQVSSHKSRFFIQTPAAHAGLHGSCGNEVSSGRRAARNSSHATIFSCT